MRYLLDTNILIYLVKNQPPAIALRVDALPETDRLCMSFVTWAELLKGAERSTRKPEVLRRLEIAPEELAAHGVRVLKAAQQDGENSADFPSDDNRD